jgi:hypothetical protein
VIQYKLTNPKKRFETIIQLSKYLETIMSVRDAQLKSLDNRAFGELDNFKGDSQISYEQWGTIYKKHGWTEVEKYKCFYNPNEVTQQGDVTMRNQVIKGDKVCAFKSYKQEMLYKDSYEVWNRYFKRWQLKYSLIEKTPVDLSILKTLNTITIEEAFFIRLGISPTVLSKSGFHDWSLFDLEPPTNKAITYQDYNGKEWKTNTGINNLIEDKLTDTDEYKILIRMFDSKHIKADDFVNWAINSEYIEEDKALYRDIEKSPYGEEFADLLYKELTAAGLISQPFERLWMWLAHWNTLHYLAKQLQLNGLTKSKSYFKNIQAYIHYTASTDLRKQIQPEAYDDKGGKNTSPDDYKVDTVIASLLKK